MKDDLDKLAYFISNLIYKYADTLDIESMPSPEFLDRDKLNISNIKNIVIEPKEKKWYNYREIKVQTLK